MRVSRLGRLVAFLFWAALGSWPVADVAAAEDVIPHGQSQAPGPPLAPAEAIRKMTVPDGFRVELVASEPDIVNPVAMTFDERGRVWITESLEYPRQSAGPGRDRVKVLEDTDRDGRADKFTVFADGLNIPSGIAVGYGGVWVANSPDILFLRDDDGDGRADRREVVVTGFGRSDTHELPNTLAWGPDGWLYGWNGVFNPSHVSYRGKAYRFTCAIFRIHPVTRDFEIFCEGTSNPWGIAWDAEGSAFASACVIDHLWHLTETGYYHRQGGEYPAYTWKLGSIVNHTHQKAAYCGIHFFDSDAYPPQFREKLFMGNIHGNCINVDRLEREGASYRAEAEPDFLSANDAWFMPVVQKTGPDGCLYILDWYDRYHCYQDANRDPAGIDRLKGRLYRVRYQDTPRAPRFDLAKESDDELIERLASPNLLFRELAQRVLAERHDAATALKLQKLVLDGAATRKTRMHALWTLVSFGPMPASFHERLLNHPDAGVRAWAVRAAGNARSVDSAIYDRIQSLAADPSPDVQLQVAVAAPKLEGHNPLPLLVNVLAHCGSDALIPHIVWQNLHPRLEQQASEFVQLVERLDPKAAPALEEVLPRAVERLVGGRQSQAEPVARLLTALCFGRLANAASARRAFDAIASRIQSGEVAGPRLEDLRSRIQPVLQLVRGQQPESELAFSAAVLAASWNDDQAIERVRRRFETAERPEATRIKAFEALLAARGAVVLNAAIQAITARSSGSAAFRGRILSALGRLDDPRVAQRVLEAYPRLEPDLQPRAIELLTQRPAWSLALLEAIRRQDIPSSALNVNQVRKLQNSKDPEVAKQVREAVGTVREGRNPAREQVLAQMRTILRNTPGHAETGQQVFKKLCAQCHKIYGEGQDVGPDISANGRSDYEQLLSNVFDPSLVIGAAYQATTVATNDGRVLTGLLAEDSAERVVLKTQGGKVETIPRNDVEEMKVSPLSLMPEDVEKQLTTQELADLFAFLCLDKPPSDPSAKRLPGSPSFENSSPARAGQR